MSDTPKTDSFAGGPFVTSAWTAFARTLERENNALRLRLAETEGRLEALRESRRPVVEVKP